MSRPHATYKIFSGAVMSGTNTIVSVAIDTTMVDLQLGIEFQITGTPTGGGTFGGFSLEGSNQYDPVNNPNATFIPIISGAPLTPAIVQPAGAGSSQLCALSGTSALPFHWLRMRYVNASGSGTVDAWVNHAGAA
jgi:hypothetical protein